jgi:hypothetical protein
MAEFVRVASTSDIPSGEGRVFEIGGAYLAKLNVDSHYHSIDTVS